MATDDGLVDLNTTPEEIAIIVDQQRGIGVLTETLVVETAQDFSVMTGKTESQPSSVTPDVGSLEWRNKVFLILADLCGEVTQDTPRSETLDQLGIDFLAAEELKTMLEDIDVNLCSDQKPRLQEMTLGELLDGVGCISSLSTGSSPIAIRSLAGTSTSDSLEFSDGCLVFSEEDTRINISLRASSSPKPKTFVCKNAGDTSVEAAVYLPMEDRNTKPMAVGTFT